MRFPNPYSSSLFQGVSGVIICILSGIIICMLFRIYINDLCFVCKHTNAILFADDTNLFSSGKDLKNLESATNSELSHIYLWLNVNKLLLNIKKIHYMIFCRHNKLCHDVKLLIDGQAINEVQKNKFLGIIIDNQITWKWHINCIVIRVLAQAGKRSSFDPLYKKYNIMRIIKYQHLSHFIGPFMFCVSNNIVPQSFGSLFRKKQWIS